MSSKSSIHSSDKGVDDASLQERDGDRQVLNQNDEERANSTSSNASVSGDGESCKPSSDSANSRADDVKSPSSDGEGKDGSDSLLTTLSVDEPKLLRVDGVVESATTEGETIVAKGPRDESSELQLIGWTPDDGLNIGEMFGQFKIVRYVGGGGMGHVYEAFDCDLERKVAIKILPKKKAEDPTVVARFLNEAKSSARLNHENIAQVYLSGNISGITYIAMEYVEGVNLRDWVRNNGALELSDAINYVLQTASALSHAASHGVTHRDVKPSNIIVTPQKRVKLIDMGLARILRSSKDDDLTESGVTLGTFDYISPEQAKDPRLADVRSDVYSLGCSFYFFLTGSPPFPDGTALQKLLMHQGDVAPDVRERNPSIPVEIAAVVRKMMMKNPDDRYQTPDVLIDDLLQIVEMLHLNVAQRDYVDATKQKKKTTTIPTQAIPAIAAALVLTSFVVFMYLLDSGSTLTLPTVEAPPVVATIPEEKPLVASDSGEEGTSDSGEETAANGKNPTDETAAVGATSFANAGFEYESGDIDALYATAYFPTLEETPALFVDETREEFRTFLNGDVSAADSRAAFGWNASPFQGAKASADSDDDTIPWGTTFFANVAEIPDDEFGASSKSFTAYSFLDTTNGLISGAVPDSGAETLRIVDGRGEDANTFATLHAALAAPSRDPSEVVRVELRFDEKMETAPISLFDRNVEVTAAEGCRPTLVFKPAETSDGGWGRRMFLLDSSKLAIRGVDIDFTVPSQDVVASEWSVYEALGASELTLEDSVVSVNNMTGDSFTSPLHSNVAFFRASDDSLLDSVFDSTSSDDGSVSTTDSYNIRLDNVLARGEATLFYAERSGGRYEVRNSGFNISGPFLHYVDSGGVETDAALRFTLELDHIVALGRSCLVRLDSEQKSELSHAVEVVADEKNASSTGEAIVPQYVATRRLPHFVVKAANSILRFENQSFALVTSPALVDLEAFENEWTFDRLIALDVAAFWRRRSSRTNSWQDYAFDPGRYRSESASLKELNGDAHERLENIPPHLFSPYDFSNWILNPIHTASNLPEDFRKVSDEIKQDFIDKFFE